MKTIEENNIIELITRYLSGEATPGEIHELERWVHSDPGNEIYFKELASTWQKMEDSKISSTFDIDREWLKITNRIHPPESMPHEPAGTTRLFPRLLRIAAVFLLLAIPSFFLYRYLTAPEETKLTAGNSIIETTLPDGTMVTLNAGSQISYPSRFKGALRQVTLQGEAWFEVEHDRSRPFIIAAENVRIRVAGTSFFVNTKTADDSKEIILATGHVKVYYESRPGVEVFLQPGEKAEAITDGYAIIKTKNSDQNFLSWKTGHLVFNHTSLEEVAGTLEKVFHTPIRLKGDQLNNCRITATFDKQSLESVLKVMKATLNLKVQNNGKEIEISGDGCR